MFNSQISAAAAVMIWNSLILKRLICLLGYHVMATKTSTSMTPAAKTDLDLALRTASEDVKQVFSEAMARLADAAKPSDDPKRSAVLFFPDGIQLIQLVFKVGQQIDITLTIAGPKDPKTAPPPPTKGSQDETTLSDASAT
ncbi:hypothetical protein PQR71_06925 [Paraburkholderia fungorum]|uniref:hypothetical protein n=1 Tax=Paraburkholderia fungorum TaxID=134537 RepID=UPI0038B90A55